MLGIKEFSRVVSEVSAAPANPASWQTALAEITTCMGATAATVALHNGAARTVLASTLTPEATTPYVEYYRRMDFVMASCEAGPIGLVQGGWTLVGANRRTEFHNDWQRRFDITDGLAVRLATQVPASFVVSAPRRADPFATAERMQFVDALVPHLQRALSAGELITGWHNPFLRDDRTDELGEVGLGADAIRHGFVLVDVLGRILGMNAPALRITSLRDGLRLRVNTIEAGSPASDQKLRSAIKRATTPGARHGGQVVCGRPSGSRPYVLHVIPVGGGDDPQRTRAAVIIVDPEDQPRPPEALLRAMFGLTPAQSRIALRLLEGDTVQEIADTFALSVATIRTHLQQLYRKTDTARQTDLVRLLLSLQP